MLSQGKEELLKNWAEESNTRIYFKNIKAEGKQFQFKTDSRLSLATYGKIFAITEMDKPFLYLDSDIFAEKNWDCIFDELSKVVASDFTLGAKFEFFPNASTSTNLAISQSGDRYFNAGVLLVDPSKIESKKTLRTVKKLLGDYESNGFWSHDQDLLNSIFLEEVLSIPLMYNQNPWISAQSRPRLVHVEGFYKPWKMTNFVFLFFLLIPILTDFFCLFTKGRIYSRTKIFIDYKRQEIKILNYLNMKLSKGVYSGRTPKLAMKKNLTIKLIIHHLSRRFQGDDSAIKY
jgi:lipopolysaccharide biosynthesis glycosyltransferase